MMEKRDMLKSPGFVDTGAVDHAIPEDELTWIPLEPSPMSEQGRAFRGPNHSRIPAKGRRRFDAILGDRSKSNLNPRAEVI